MQRFFGALFLCLVSASAALAMQSDPAGLGKLKLGMSPQEVEKLYPGKVRTLTSEHLGATPIQSPNIIRQVIANQKLPGLEGESNVELRFWKQKLWVIIVYYGGNTNEEIDAALRKEYGKPDLASSDLVWRSKKVQVNTANRERWYAIADLALSADAQKAFAEDMRKAQERMQAGQQAGQQAPAPAPNAAAPK